MEMKITAIENDQADRARIIIGADNLTVTIEGKGDAVVQVLSEIMTHEGSTLQQAILEGVGEFESKEQIEALFAAALQNKGVTQSLTV